MKNDIEGLHVALGSEENAQ